MKKFGRKFRPKEKEAAILEWQELGGGTRNAKAVARRHNCSIQSLYLWHAQYNGTHESLENGDQTPRIIWNKYTQHELNHVKEVLEMYPQADRLELYARLQLERGFTKSIRTLYRMLKILNVAPIKDLEKYIPKMYDTPGMVGIKWQIDVKYVPVNCLADIPNSAFYDYSAGYKLYQYTCIDECSRKRFTYIYDRVLAKNAKDFMKRCIVFFGYKPVIVQTDNGVEFCTFTEKNERKEHKKNKGEYSHKFTNFLYKQGIRHDLIKVATPRHNGKVERSHRTDNQCFYAHQSFTSLEDARAKAKEWLYRYNNVRPMTALGYRTPQAIEDACLSKLRADNKVTYMDLERPRRQGCQPYKVERQGKVQFTPKNERWALADRPVRD